MAFHPAQQPALVSRPLERPGEADRYLILGAQGPAGWTLDPSAATQFESMREATRAAMHLPSGLRAYGLPLRGVLAASGTLH